ncbi:MAG: D-glycero-beta-D-manno-heptose 1,7-bisphosphate 7-phosphatase, partial [Betaproteobacteria bacterium]|nr:D-glycero-beta-D-manno-heptose 1,7-bisphosphate 7-phosphatase [Betaproteobacteria bacterium]
MTQSRFVIIDRDGVINVDSEAYVKSPEEWTPIARSLEAIALLTQAGWRIAVVTNQAGLSRGLFDLATLNRIHARMHEMVQRRGGRIEAVFFCPHGPQDGCTCRKPKPGMLLEAADRFDTDLSGQAFVGDSLRDLQAAQAASMQPVLVRTGNG